MKALLQKVLPASSFDRIRLATRPARLAVKRLRFRMHSNDLTWLALNFGTDKAGAHWYTQHYQRYFQPLRHKRMNVLEIGVGGYQQDQRGGASLRMWKMYFPNSRIVGIDIFDKTQFSESRIDIRICDQTDAKALTALSEEYGRFDIIIDDGSHQSPHIIETFHVMFPLLKDGGIYVIEDTQTAYWTTWAGGFGDPKNSMEFFKGLVDGLNHVEYPIENYQPTYFDQNIVEIAFFHNLIFVVKGKNDEKTNIPEVLQEEIEALREKTQKSA